MDEMIVESQSELERLEQGVPLHKVLGYIEMTDVVIDLSKDVLIPRYETEELILLAKEYITQSSKVLDLCSGSGYIGLAIKKMTGAKVTASDISKEAISQIEINKKKNNLDIEVIESDLFENISGKFDVIISNPPYIPQNNTLSESVLKYEPHLALFGGEDGNDLYKRIVAKYKNHLNPGGVILFEISEDNVDFLAKQGFKIVKDINGKSRIAIKSQ
ncbi:peptide chain release factor N(5)-glutamine methyltransferase [Mycoplasma todarodis]|uniref:peptide chain release factor N(5)-glutamine methyltransferase n=2 Tax=Mycoplasma todarodis TaxID=1937191 RepID=A0A4R0XQH3_9MOLU|nr:peptide chain release factor N(5)-glutamine methyltransferase [Mycoplasma todarodis]